VPSYYRDRRRRNLNRYEILRLLNKKQAQRYALQDLFTKIISAVLPKRKAVTTAGYTEAHLSIPLPGQYNRRFYQLLYELKRDGLISEAADTKRTVSITNTGLLWLKSFSGKEYLTLPRYKDPAEEQDRVTIVSYDIPEKLRPLRAWLRSSLRNFGLRAMQRSVFIGKIKLPEYFIADITQFRLEKYVEIFEITKAGTLRHKL